MPARKIPLVWKGQKDSDQTYFKYNPTTGRVVQSGFGCTSAPPPPQLPVNLVGVGSGDNTLLYSSDGGMTWTGLGNSIFTGEGNCAAWNGTLWVAGGYGTNALAYSYDGINWVGLGDIVTGPASTLGIITSVTWNGSIWVAVAGANDEYATSPDGINWTGYKGVNTFGAQFLATDGNIIVGIPSVPSGSLFMSFTYNGLTWGAIIDPNLTNEQILEYTDILWDGTQFIITVATRGNPVHSKFYSPDGLNWTGIPNVGYVDGRNIGKTTGTLYVSRGVNPDATETSTNGTVWTNVANPAYPVSSGIQGTIVGTDQHIIVCGYTNNTYIYTSNGTSWTLKNTGVSGNFKAAFFKKLPF